MFDLSRPGVCLDHKVIGQIMYFLLNASIPLPLDEATSAF